jgi:hypothetical protein
MTLLLRSPAQDVAAGDHLRGSELHERRLEVGAAGRRNRGAGDHGQVPLFDDYAQSHGIGDANLDLSFAADDLREQRDLLDAGAGDLARDRPAGLLFEVALHGDFLL